jgi:hypothetical protein
MSVWMQLRPRVRYAIMKSGEIRQIPADPPLAEELAREDVVEMANLTQAQTGVPGRD